MGLFYFRFLLHFIFYFYIFIVCCYIFIELCVGGAGKGGTHVSRQVCGSRGTAYRNQFSPSARWVPGVEVRLSGLVAVAFAH